MPTDSPTPAEPVGTGTPTGFLSSLRNPLALGFGICGLGVMSADCFVFGVDATQIFRTVLAAAILMAPTAFLVYLGRHGGWGSRIAALAALWWFWTLLLFWDIYSLALPAFPLVMAFGVA